MASASFQKISKTQVPHIQGTRQSVQSAQLLTSSGVPSLDNVIGGSLPVGTLLLIEEDIYGTFAKVILKYFLSEGVTNGHALFLASLDMDPHSLMKQLPSPVAGSSEAEPTVVGSHDEKDLMSIAWRYQNMSKVQSTPGSSETQLGHNFDLTKLMPAEYIEKCDTSLWHGSEAENSDEAVGGFHIPTFGKLLRAVQQNILQGEFQLKDDPKQHNVLRIALHSLASPLWVSDSCLEPNVSDIQRDLCRFLLLLRSLLRNSYAVAVVTVPTHLYNSAFADLCEHQCDYALGLESFAGSSYETNPAFKEYHGLLHVRKIGTVNSLTSHVPDSIDLGFKLKRKKFLIEKLHLPPELQESTQREQDDASGISSKSTVLSCSSRQSLDF